MKHRTCKYGDSCKFRHPQSVAIAPTEKPDEYDARMKARDEKKKKATERRKARRKLAKNAKKEESEEDSAIVRNERIYYLKRLLYFFIIHNIKKLYGGPLSE